MSLHRTIIRYYLIISKVIRPGFPSFDEILEMLNDNDFAIAPRTLQRDIQYIRHEFGIEILYNPQCKGYYIDKSISRDFNAMMRYLELATLAGTFKEFFEDTSQVKEFISFDAQDAIKGVEFISTILLALKSKKQIILEYHKFNDEKPFQIEIKPGLLKQYQNRWYIIALNADTGDQRTYSLDRIQSLCLSENEFKSSDVEALKECFNHVIGVSFPHRKPELIELTFEKDQSRYIASLPWHLSQEVIREDDQTVTFRYYIVRNYELEQKILAQGNNIKKISPKGLAEKIMNRK